MLIALTEQSQRFISYEYPRQVLQQQRQQEKFYCPQCHQPVQLKIGTINIPHFAHIANQACDQLFAEGESALHLSGKIQLFEWFEKLGHTVELEPYLPELAQRPDILLTKEGRFVAIEFQCSPISSEKWQMRTNGYTKNGITAIWLFQTPSKKSIASGIQKISIAPLLQHAITHPLKGLPYLVTFDANTSQFIYWSNLLHLQGHTYITKVQYLPIDKQLYPFYEPKPLLKEELKHYWHLYKKTGEQYIYQRLLRSKTGVQDPFLRSCYEMGLTLEKIPVHIGLPVKDAQAIPYFSIEWQTLLHYFCRQLQLQPKQLCKGDIQLFLHQLGMEPLEEAIRAVKYYSTMFETMLHSKDYLAELYGHLFAFEPSN